MQSHPERACPKQSTSKDVAGTKKAPQFPVSASEDLVLPSDKLLVGDAGIEPLTPCRVNPKATLFPHSRKLLWAVQLFSETL
jgi:hypothetical protein